MKKKSLLIVLLMALFLPWAANAQETLTVYGDNTTTNEFVPIYGYYADSKSKCEFIIPSEKISAMNGSVISAMKLYLDHSDNGSYFGVINATFEVFVKEVEATTLTGFLGQSDATTVFNSTITIEKGASNVEIDIPFSSNYIYGGGNLLVGFYQTTATGYNHTYWTGEAQTTNTAWGGYVSSASAKQFLPKTTFTYEFVTTPTITLPATATVLTGLTTELTATLMNVTGTPTITYTSSDDKVAAVIGNGTTATVTGVSAGTATITATMTYDATDYTATCVVTVEDPSYCSPYFGSPSDDYIANFATTGGDTNINNTSTYETGGYSDYYATASASIEAGNTLSCTVTPSSTSYAYGHAIWVDWNKNYEFEASERVAYSTASATGNWTGEFEVPVTTAAGDYRLRVLHVYNGGNVTDPCLSANYGEGEDYKLTVTAANPYQKPVNLQVSNLTNSTATITWEAPNSDVQSYKYQYQPEGGTWTDLTTTTTLSAPLTSLTGNTTYEFQVQAIYAGDNESAFASASFTTPCAAYPITYEYGFETADDMDCWEQVDCELASGYLYDSAGNAYAKKGNGCYYFSSYSGNTEPQYLISPELSGIAKGLHVSFYYRSLQDNDPETFMVGYSTTDKDPDSFTWTTEVTSPDGSYYPYAVNFMVPAIKYIAVKYTSADSYYLFIDDFTFEEAPDCLEPTDVDALNITTTTADITWTNGGEETEWDIFATNDLTIVPDETTTPTVSGVTTKPYQLTLLPGTTYYVYVRAACSAKEHSAWSSPKTFHTNCEGMDLPYGPYGFEDGALTVCWNILSTNVAYNTVSIDNTPVHTGTYSMMMHSGSADGDFVVALPVIDDSYSLSDYRFVFWAMASNTTLKATIGIMEDPNDMTTFVAQGEEFNPASEYTEYKIPFNGYTGNGHYVAIKVSRAASSSYGNVYIDDIAIELLPSCMEPSALNVTAPTAHGATFDWTAGGSETEWHLYFSKTNDTPADDIDLQEVTIANSNPFTLTTGLDAETNYYVWVRANCGGSDGYSPWIGPETFTTGIACPAPTGFNYSEVTAHTAKLSWDGTSDSYNVWYRTAATMSNPIFNETFETSSLPTGWGRSSTALTDDVLNGTTPINSVSGGWVNTSYGLGQYNWKMNIYSTSKYWLITPSITLDAKNTLNFDAAITAYNSNNAPTSSNMANANSRFVVLITTDNQATWTILREWNNTGSADVLNNISNTGNNFSIDLTAYAGETVKIAFYGGQTASGPDCDLHIDNVMIGEAVAAGTWKTKTTDASPYQLTGLLGETKYEAKMQGDCGSEGTSAETASIFFTTDIACPAPQSFGAYNPKSNSIDLNWINGGAANWVLAIKKTGDADFTEMNLSEMDVTVSGDEINYILGSLEAETEYTVKVRDNCEATVAGDGMSEWTNEVTFSTIAACSVLNPVVDGGTITHHNATVVWDGESATGFKVYYRTAAGINASFSETFDAATLPTGWDKSNTPLTDDVLAGTTTIATGYQYGWSSTSYGLGQYNWKMNIYSTNKYWLITPSVTIGTNNILNFDAAITKYNGDIAPTTTNMADANSRFVVLITTDDMATWTILREWNNTGSADVLNNISNTGNNFTIDLSSYKDETVKIAFYGHQGSSGPDCDLHIDNVMVGAATSAGEWESEAATGTTADLTGLTAGTKYDVKVVPNCDPTIESETVRLTTLDGNTKYFLTEGDWNESSNWMDGEIPTIADNAIIRANATIASGLAAANNITFESTTTTLTIEDGAQLNTNNAANVKVEKNITAWNNDDNTGWYTIASPVSTYSTSSVMYFSSVTNLQPTGSYDIFRYNESQMLWENNINSNNTFTSFESGRGYLYRKGNNDTLSFNGYVHVAASYTQSLTYSAASDDLKGFALLGNPYTHNITLANVVAPSGSDPFDACYVLSGEGAWATAISTEEIKPCQGFLVQTTAAGTATINKTAQDLSGAKANNDYIKLVVANSEYEDATYALFTKGHGLNKIDHRNANIQKVYIPQDGESFAVATMDDNTQAFNLNFKAMTTGKYTLSYKAKGEFNYLHVIDRLTGADVDMLIEGEYSFIGSQNDNEARFIVRLGYMPNHDDNGEDIFAYQNGSDIVVSGEGELQIFDVTGRMVSAMNVNGVETIATMPTGVYVFRLVGNDVKTQKIVVR